MNDGSGADALLLNPTMSTDPTTEPRTAAPTTPMPASPAPMSPVRGAIAGVAAAAIALAIGEFVAGVLAPTPSPVTAVANRVIDNSPQWLDRLGKDLFGTNQKTALIVGTVVISLLIAAGLGVLSRRRAAPGVLGIIGFGAIGLYAIAVDSQASPVAAAVIAPLATLAGVVSLAWLLEMASTTPATPLPTTTTIASSSAPQPARRSFLGWLGAAGALTAFSTLAGRAIRANSSAESARDAVELVGTEAGDAAASELALANATPVAETPGITPIVVPNDDFYRIDTALLVPQVNPDNWQLTIGGMVDRPRTYSFEELVERATMVEPVTLSCVSNEVGGGLVGNAIWQGVPLTDLLDDVGVQQGATQIASRSVDGWTCGFPTDLAYDGRIAMVAIAMNDEALPIEHGFPARLVVSGLYGYVSATKWLTEISLTRLEDFDGYWIPRGWSKDGPVKTQSRIDTPRNGRSVDAGTEVAIAGVAWAPATGIRKVEVQVDDGPWMEAELGASLGIHAWRQWRVVWTPTEGEHRIRVRATDESGETQTEERSRVDPDGATGWHTITVDA